MCITEVFYATLIILFSPKNSADVTLIIHSHTEIWTIYFSREASPPKSRRTPERTQSLRERESPLRTIEADQSQAVKRAASFRDPGNVAIRRRFHGNTGKADEELQSILNRRSRHLEDWEEAMAKEEVTDQEKVNWNQTRGFNSFVTAEYYALTIRPPGGYNLSLSLLFIRISRICVRLLVVSLTDRKNLSD